MVQALMATGIRASQAGLEKVNKKFNRSGKTQEFLAGRVDCTRQTVAKFLAGGSIYKPIFVALCEGLDVDWLEVADLREKGQPSLIGTELVEPVRVKVEQYLMKRCGTMRVLDMEQPITLNSIYTTVNILDRMSRNRRLSVDELSEACGGEDFDRLLLGSAKAERVPGLEAVQRHRQLMILGKPGAGKTTFLKWLTLQCLAGAVRGDRVPFFITLREFAEAEEQPDLASFLAAQLEACGITDARGTVGELFQAGRWLLLLDGLDEVRSVDHDRVLATVRQVAQQFAENQFIITCRIAAREYIFDQFTEVQVADFDDQQINDFAAKWFQSTDPVKAKEFPQVLREKDHKGLRDLATNPLLLTLLCLVFGSRGGFPANRSELYSEGIDVLLKKWDVNRNIRREELYQQLSLKRKEDLLSHIAHHTFSQGEYFFKQKLVEAQIQDYIRNLPSAASDPESLQIDSEVVLKAIEAHHGLLVERARAIYSFSHLTFQEFFTARYFKEKASGDFSSLVSHINDKRWREVFLLTSGMLGNINQLIIEIKQWNDKIVVDEEKIQKYLQWIEQKSTSMQSGHKLTAIRAYYLIFTLSRISTRNFDAILDLDRALDNELSNVLYFEISHFLFFTLELSHALHLTHGCERYTLNLVSDLALDLARELASSHESNYECINTFQRILQNLKDQLPMQLSKDEQEAWWQSNGYEWTDQLRTAMIEHRNIGHDWQFSEEQRQLLLQYYDANKLLVDCMNSDCYVSREVRAAIEDQLLLPMASLAKLSPIKP
jgi:predicted NACHT family NTPase